MICMPTFKDSDLLPLQSYRYLHTLSFSAATYTHHNKLAIVCDTHTQTEQKRRAAAAARERPPPSHDEVVALRDRIEDMQVGERSYTLPLSLSCAHTLCVSLFLYLSLNILDLHYTQAREDAMRQEVKCSKCPPATMQPSSWSLVLLRLLYLAAGCLAQDGQVAGCQPGGVSINTTTGVITSSPCTLPSYDLSQEAKAALRRSQQAHEDELAVSLQPCTMWTAALTIHHLTH